MTQAASAYARIELDKYFTPRWVTEALLSVESFSGGMWDPAAGAGHMVEVFPEPSYGSDLAPDAPHIKAVDFFDIQVGSRWPNIVTNPPYGIGSRMAVRFIQHALGLTEPLGGKVAMLLKVGFDSAGGRRGMFADHPAFAAEWRLTRRIRWANLEQSSAGPTENHSWFVWDWRKRGGPAVKGYLPIEGGTGNEGNGRAMQNRRRIDGRALSQDRDDDPTQCPAGGMGGTEQVLPLLFRRDNPAARFRPDLACLPAAAVR